MSLAFSIAKRFLLSNKLQSILIILGIAIGISVQLFIGLLIQGLQMDLIDTTVGSSPHITITSDSSFTSDDVNFYNEKITESSNNLLVEGLLNIDDKNIPIFVKATTFKSGDIANLGDKLVLGTLPSSNQEIIISTFYEDVLVGDQVSLTTYLNSDNEIRELTNSYTVSGKFDFGNLNINEKYLFMNFDSLQKTYSLNNRVSSIELQVKNVFDSEEIANSIKGELDTKYTVSTWQDENADLIQALSSQSLSSYIIQVCVIISVSLAIASVLIISVVQKSKQIGILKAMGLSNRSISNVFLSQGIILGFIGSGFGILLGISLLVSFTNFAVDSNGESVINIYYNLDFIIITFAIGLFSAVIASLIPARKSKKLSAMEVISNG